MHAVEVLCMEELRAPEEVAPGALAQYFLSTGRLLLWAKPDTMRGTYWTGVQYVGWAAEPDV